MTPDELDDVLRRTLGAGRGAPSPAGDLDAVLARGRARRRRRQTGLAGAAAAVVLVGGLTFAARRDPTPPVGRDASTVAPPTTAPTTVTTSATPTTVATTPLPTAARQPAPPLPIDVVVQKGTTLVIARGASTPTDSAIAETVDACADVTETPCDVPVVAVAGGDLWFLRRTPSRRELVHHHDGADDVVRSGDVADVAIGAEGRLYLLSTGGVLTVADTAGDATVADGVREVVATTDGRLAWVTAAGIVVRAADDTDRTVAFDAPPSQLSFAPSGALLLVRTSDGRRAVVDTAAGAVVATFDATAACWGVTDATIWSYDGTTDRDGSLSGVNPRTGAALRLDGEPFRAAQIACTPTGAVAYVDPNGVLVRAVPGSGQVTYAAGGFDRVRSVR